MIGTHNGKFHADEALACFMLKQLPDFKSYQVVRSRDPKVLEKCDVLVDVGGIFNHATRRYDHHQPGFKHTMSTLMGKPYHTLLSSAGLVFAFYGRRIIAQRLEIHERNEKVTMIFSGVYKGFIQEIDRVDNGASLLSSSPFVAVGRCKLVSELNPNGKTVPDAVYDERFHQASALIGGEFLKYIDQLAEGLQISRPSSESNSETAAHRIFSFIMLLFCFAIACNVKREKKEDVLRPRERLGSDSSESCLEQNEYIAKVWWPAREIVEKAVDERCLVGLRSWNILFAVYHNETDRMWIVHCIPESRSEKFSARRHLPKSWWGLNNEDLSRYTGIDGCVFVHRTGYIGGNKTKNGALQMAICAVEGRRRQQHGPSNCNLAGTLNLDNSQDILDGSVNSHLAKKNNKKSISPSMLPSSPIFCRFDVLR